MGFGPIGREADAVIVGAGFAGLALAYGLERAGHTVELLERRTELPDEGAGMTLQPSGLLALDRLGLWDLALAVGHRFERISVRNTDNDEVAAWLFSELEATRAHLLCVRRRTLLEALAEQLDSSPRFGCAVTQVRPGEVAFDGPEGRQAVRGKWVIGADGGGSTVRRQLGGPLWTSRPDPYVVGLGARPPELDEGDGLIYVGDGFGNGVFPLGELAYFWDHVVGDAVAAVEAGDFGGWQASYARKVPCGATVAAPFSSFDDVSVLSGRVQLLRSLSSAGIALIGDAAGTVHPHSGQGANLAFEDAADLADLIASGVGSLQGWTRARRRRRLAIGIWSLFAARAQDGPNPVWRTVRSSVHGLNRIGPARRAMLRPQAGL